MPAGQQDVFRLDVAMNDASRVRVRERIEEVAPRACRFTRSERDAAFQSMAKRLALDEWHRVIEKRLRGAGAQDRHDVWMLQLSRRLDLATEPVDAHARRHVR